MAMEVRYWDGCQWKYRMERDLGKIEMMLADEEAERQQRAEEREQAAEQERLEAEERDGWTR